MVTRSDNSPPNFTSDMLYCGNLKMPVLLIFSQRSYITKEVLSLRPKHTESMMIRTFGTSMGERQLCDVGFCWTLLERWGYGGAFSAVSAFHLWASFLSTCDVCQLEP